MVAFFEKELEREIGNCELVEIPRESVDRLIDSCEKVLADHSLAEELLPTQSGFFFGDTGYGENYFENVEDVLRYCKEILIPEYEALDESLEYIAFKIWY